MNTYTYILLLALIVSGCASQPHSLYKQARGAGPGYSEKAITANHYRVQFKVQGNQRTRAMDYAMLRAADVTLAQGYDWFAIINRDTKTLTETHNTQDTFGTDRGLSQQCGLLGCRIASQRVPEQHLDIEDNSHTVVTLEIRMGKGVRPATGNDYDAAEIHDRFSR